MSEARWGALAEGAFAILRGNRVISGGSEASIRPRGLSGRSRSEGGLGEAALPHTTLP
jgi:hypothetical protein